MMLEKNKFILAVSLILSFIGFFSSCKKTDTELTREKKCSLDLCYSLEDLQEVEIESIKELKFIAKEVNTNKEIQKEGDENGKVHMDLEKGLYNFQVSALVEYKLKQKSYGLDAITAASPKKDKVYSIKIAGSTDGIEVKDNLKEPICIKAYKQGKIEEKKTGSYKDLVLSEIYISGSKDESDNTYFWDSYFVIHNNSDKLVYADSLCLMESEFNTELPHITEPLKVNEKDFMANLIYMIPGNGKDYPIAPGAHIVLADQAKDHQTICPNSVNLSTANFEWYEPGKGGKFFDEDNPKVPNLIKVYSYSRTFWRPNMQGNTAFAIGKMIVSPEKFVKDYVYPYKWVVNESLKKDMTCYRFPKEWIADAVQFTPKENLNEAFQVVDRSLDQGFTYNHIVSMDHEGFSKSQVRKIAKNKGIIIYLDTNNSTEDFLPMQEPSMKK